MTAEVTGALRRAGPVAGLKQRLGGAQLVAAIWPGRLALKEGGVAVVIAQSVEGQALHYMSGRFGTDYGGTMWHLPQQLLVPQADRILVCSEYPFKNDLYSYGPLDQVVSCDTWEAVLENLSKDYPGEAKVAVYPYTAIQLPPPGAE